MADRRTHLGIERGWIACGGNSYDRRDGVYADRIDVVASDCEIVHRR